MENGVIWESAGELSVAFKKAGLWVSTRDFDLIAKIAPYIEGIETLISFYTIKMEWFGRDVKIEREVIKERDVNYYLNTGQKVTVGSRRTDYGASIGEIREWVANNLGYPPAD